MLETFWAHVTSFQEGHKISSKSRRKYISFRFESPRFYDPFESSWKNSGPTLRMSSIKQTAEPSTHKNDMLPQFVPRGIVLPNLHSRQARYSARVRGGPNSNQFLGISFPTTPRRRSGSSLSSARSPPNPRTALFLHGSRKLCNAVHRREW